MKILIAEDEVITCRRLEKHLKSWGHEVTPAANGVEAFELYLSGDFDMVITDWMMPEMEGSELVRRIRNRRKSFVYIIFLTAKSEKSDMTSALFDIGADDFIRKPFDVDELRARVKVGERTVRLERELWEYGKGLEDLVKRQTQIIRKTQEETIIKLLSMLESRDQETGGHVRRISDYSGLMAEAMGWPDSRIDQIRLAAPMHDIGKVGVPDQILHKPEKLTESEFEIIKTHSTIGGRILEDSQSPMLKMAHEIALYHHERWDGSGYPAGLDGENIPETARIVALADVFDALSTDRVYRKALPEVDVLNIMDSIRNSHFDPDFYAVFLSLLPRFREVIAHTP